MTPVTAQDVTTKEGSRLSVGLSFSPDITYRTLKGDGQLNEVIEVFNRVETSKFGFTTGAFILYSLNERWLLESGLFYTSQGYQTRKTEIIWPPDPPQPGDGVFQIFYTFQSLDVPLKVNYVLLDKKIRVFASAGISTNVLLDNEQKIVIDFYDQTSQSSSSAALEDPASLYMSALAGLGLDYNFTGNWSLRFEPVFRHAFTSISNSDLKQYPFSVGANVGVFYQI